MKVNLYSFDGTESKISETYRPDRYRDLYEIINQSSKIIIRGGGLSYCNAGCSDSTILSQQFNRIEKFDKENGFIIVESGITVGELIAFTAKFGWYFPVLPGHPSITIGVVCLLMFMENHNTIMVILLNMSILLFYTIPLMVNYFAIEK